jgi:hypothetical protein
MARRANCGKESMLRQLRGVMTATFLAIGVAVLAAACGGGDEKASTGASGSAEFTARSAEFPLPRRSDIATKDAYVTFTSQSDGKTTAAVEIYVPRTPETQGDTYPVSVQEGDCSSLGGTTISLGDLSDGISVVVLEEAFDEAVLPIEGGSSSVVIREPDKKTIAWCGPSPS